MLKRKTRCRRKRTGKFLWVIAGIMGAVTFSIAVYMLLLTKQENNLIKPDEEIIGKVGKG